jgi:hypothetical protein
VAKRFKEKAVLIYDEERAYRTLLLKDHNDFRETYAEEARKHQA